MRMVKGIGRAGASKLGEIKKGNISKKEQIEMNGIR